MSANPNYVICDEYFLQILSICIEDCIPGDIPCTSRCNRHYAANLKNCPCEENCPNSCPCPNYPCDESCRDIDSNPDHVICVEYFQQILSNCIEDCIPGDIPCSNKCNRQYEASLNDCPCQKNCINGCPCPNYTCVGKGLTYNFGFISSISECFKNLTLRDDSFDHNDH